MGFPNFLDFLWEIAPLVGDSSGQHGNRGAPQVSRIMVVMLSVRVVMELQARCHSS
jgi:hypothetical protein